MTKEIVVILDNIRSVANVGSIFRTSDAVGASALVLCGTTPTPVDRFGRARADMAKVSLGAEKKIPWTYEATTVQAIKKFKQQGYQIIAIEQSEKAVDYKKVRTSPQVCFVLGEEVKGLLPSVLKLADVVAEIPMHGQKESLNVSVAYGVAVFRILNI